MADVTSKRARGSLTEHLQPDAGMSKATMFAEIVLTPSSSISSSSRAAVAAAAGAPAYTAAKRTMKKERRGRLWSAILHAAGGGGGADQARAVADAIKARAAPEMRRVLLGLLQGSSGSAEPSGKAKRRKKPSTSKATRRKKASSVDKRQLVRQRLEVHSKETPDVRFDAEGNSYEARRMLTKSRRRIWHHDSVLQQMFSLRAFYRHMRKEQRLYKNVHKKGDLCEVCLEYDTRVLPKVKAMIIAVRDKYRAIHNDFFAHFLARSDGAWLGQSASSADFACIQHVNAMVSYIDSCNADVPHGDGPCPRRSNWTWLTLTVPRSATICARP